MTNLLQPPAVTDAERVLERARGVLDIEADAVRGLKARLGDAARRVPTRELPDWLVKLVAMFDPTVRQVLPDLGKYKNASGDKARRVLGWSPRGNEDALVATAESLLRLGLLKR